VVHYTEEDKAPKGKYRIMGVHLGMDFFPEEDHSSLDEAFKRCRELNKVAKKEFNLKKSGNFPTTYYVTDDTGIRRRKKRIPKKSN
jgi:hypothetical protein